MTNKEYKIVITSFNSSWGNNYRFKKFYSKKDFTFLPKSRWGNIAKLTRMPHCCGVGLLSLSGLSRENKVELSKFIEYILRNDSYGKIIYYSSDDDKTKLLESIGFEAINEFYNPRSGNDITQLELICD